MVRNRALSLLAVLILVASLTGAAERNGPASYDAAKIGAAALVLSSSARCAIDYEITVTSEAGGGTDGFTLEVWDDGARIQVHPFVVPADGGQHVVTGSVVLTSPPGTLAPGLGFYVVDNDLIYASNDPFTGFVCTVLDVPTMSRWGLALFAGLLLLASVALVLRRRTAGH